MNPNYNQSVTIYNCLRAADNPNSLKDIWYRTVLSNCYYKCVVQRSQYINGQPKMINSYVVRVPGSENYKPYREWIQLSDAERKKCFTCSEKDIVVAGICTEEITGESPDTAAQVLNRNRPDSFLVNAFSDNTSRSMAKHYRIGG